ncbi:DNA-binding response regulator [Enterococcus florum]|uniref:DNA-binding response regulator n=2 Tax=Enterococcus florum TaxID=2480627 RepID=A0A4P5PDA3_9ENTE|nr:DNA-binding response regulator [Enterococcus florum]
MIQIICCDDERIMRKSLRKIIEPELQLRGNAYEINEYCSGEALLNSEDIKEADIFFLDIEMQTLNGIETAREIRKRNQRAVIIFITAYADFVFHGYEVKAMNYILKPYTDAQIKRILHQALEELELENNFYFMIEQKSGSTKIDLKKVRYFSSDRRVIHTYLSNDKLTFYGKLNELEDQLPNFFIRIHNRFLVNLNFITVVESSWVFCGEDKLPVSRKYKHELDITFAKNILN